MGAQTEQTSEHARVDESDTQQCDVQKSERKHIMDLSVGSGKEQEFKPHARHMDVSYTQCGPDWSSKLRPLPSPKPKEGQPQETTFHPPMKSIRHFLHQHVSPKKEYKFYPPHGLPLVFENGKTTKFNQIHKASQLSGVEISQTDLFGQHHKVSDPRNGIPEASPGDKPYQVVEYSSNFHKTGSTRPVVNFGGKLSSNTIPSSLQQTSYMTTKPFSVKEEERQKADEISTVKRLESWRPSSPLQIPTMDTKP